VSAYCWKARSFRPGWSTRGRPGDGQPWQRWLLLPIHASGTAEAARRLGTAGADFYRLILDDVLAGRPDEEGIAYVAASSVDADLEAHGVENVSNNLSNESQRTGPDV
jgi:hypothetical protein